MSMKETVILAVFLLMVGIALGIGLERLFSKCATRELDMKTWERIEGWRK